MNVGSEKELGSEREVQAVMLRVPKEHYHRFNELYPWRGSITQFFYQCLDEFLKISADAQTPAELTSIAVNNVARREF